MHSILKLASCCCLLLVANAATLLDSCLNYPVDPLVKERFEEYMIVPHSIKTAPRAKLSFIFRKGATNLGNIMHPFDTFNPPYINFVGCPKFYYTIVYIDPDMPSLYESGPTQMLQYLTINILGSDIQNGDQLAVYFGNVPYPGSGAHRYVVLLYKQPKRINVTVELQKSISNNIYNFSVEAFAKEYNLGNPLAGNFFIAKLDFCDPFKNSTG